MVAARATAMAAVTVTVAATAMAGVMAGARATATAATAAAAATTAVTAAAATAVAATAVAAITPAATVPAPIAVAKAMEGKADLASRTAATDVSMAPTTRDVRICSAIPDSRISDLRVNRAIDPYENWAGAFELRLFSLQLALAERRLTEGDDAFDAVLPLDEVQPRDRILIPAHRALQLAIF